MQQVEIRVTGVGKVARRILLTARTSSVLGVSSRGIFLLCEDQKVLFLSNEAYHGPLTLNLEHPIPQGLQITPGRVFEINPVHLTLSSGELVIQAGEADEWRIQPHPVPLLSVAERRQRFQMAAGMIVEQRSGGTVSLLAELHNIRSAATSSQWMQGSWPDASLLAQHLAQFDLAALQSELERWVGLGTGLTPSGDDLVSGFLLTLWRYPELGQPGCEIQDLTYNVIEIAYRKTSLLSANLIECAGQGQADERLILALDGLMTASISPERCAQHLLSWGNTSGCDALLGMSLAADRTTNAW